MNEASEDQHDPSPDMPTPVTTPEKQSDNKREALLTTLLILGSLGLFLAFAWPFFQGRLYVEDDLAALYLPVRDFYAKCLRNGYNFLWMPHLANGFYIHGEGHGGFLHPLHFFLYRLLPLDKAFMAELLISYPIMWLGTVAFLRRWKLDLPAALFGAFFMTFIGCSMNHYVHISFIAVMAHLPWALLVIDIAMGSERSRRTTLALAACLLLSASQLYIGNPQVTYFSWLVEAFYALLLLGTRRRFGSLLHLGVMKMLALAVGAAQLLPTLVAYQASQRQDPDLGYQLGISLHPWNLLQLVNPYLFHKRVYAPLAGDEPWDALYLGAALIPLLVLLLVQFTALKRGRVLALAALALALFGLLAVLGKYGFLYHGLTRIPVVNFFRAPARYVAVIHVALALIGALSFSLLVQCAREEIQFSAKRLAVLWLVPLVSVGTLGFVVGFRFLNEGDVLATFDQNVMRSTAVAAGTLLVCAATALVYGAARGRTWALPLLIALCLFDASLYSLRHKPETSLPELMASIPLPPGDNTHRIEPDIVPYTMNQVALHGYRNVTGYLNLFPGAHLDMARPGPMRLAGVQWRESRRGTSAELHNAREAGIEWIKLADPIPRLRLVGEATLSTDPMADLEMIDMATMALVDNPITLDGGPAGTLRIEEDTPGSVRVETQTGGTQLLVLSENFHPGWRVRIDETPGDVIRAYGDFMACAVPAGTHAVHFYFWPDDFVHGLMISGGALALAVGYLVLATVVGLWWKQRRAAG